MREAAPRGFWVGSRTPYGFKRVMVQDGLKERPVLEPNPDAACLVRRIFDLADAGKGMLQMRKALNDEDTASPAGKLWTKNGVHFILRNEVYTGTLVWGANARTRAEPVRVEKAFPAIVSRGKFNRVNSLMRSPRPQEDPPPEGRQHPIFSADLLKRRLCKRAFSGQEGKSGQFAY